MKRKGKPSATNILRPHLSCIAAREPGSGDPKGRGSTVRNSRIALADASPQELLLKRKEDGFRSGRANTMEGKLRANVGEGTGKDGAKKSK